MNDNMKTKRDVLKEFKVYNEIVHDTLLLELIEDAMEYYAKQKLNLSGIGSKQLPFEFVKWYSGMRDEQIESAYSRWKKEVACASGAVDTVAEGQAIYQIVIEGNTQTVYKNGKLIEPMSDEAKMWTQLHLKAGKSSEEQP